MKITFGKYKGKELKEVLGISPAYFYFLIRKISWFRHIIMSHYPELTKCLQDTDKALDEERDAWAYTGGRMPDYDSIFWKKTNEKFANKLF